MKTKDNIGAYEKLLNTLDMNLDDPYWEREKAIRDLIHQLELVKDMGDDWWDVFMESNDMWSAIEQSCYFEQEMEGSYNAGYESGMESGYESYYEDFIERATEWKYKLVNFLKDKWVNLNK